MFLGIRENNLTKTKTQVWNSMYSTIPLTSLHNKLNSPRAMLHNRQQFSTDISKSATVHFYLLLAEEGRRSEGPAAGSSRQAVRTL
jgi:hypothetical protein